MARSTDYRCDLTDEVIALADPPLVIRIAIGLAPGSPDQGDPALLPISPFLQALLCRQPAVLELSAASFDRCLTADMGILETILPPPGTPPEIPAPADI